MRMASNNTDAIICVYSYHFSTPRPRIPPEKQTRPKVLQRRGGLFLKNMVMVVEGLPEFARQLILTIIVPH